ncbi:unnamed protein product [Paramecium octaurelia]|uniref:Uncharacterized protein n=1 Tax=Paramecium octaurelia TaxID=43137 RepID=A0A8S1X2R5_PAROT|nr:unnamed protein product [Paramecium octaurelia]
MTFLNYEIQIQFLNQLYKCLQIFINLITLYQQLLSFWCVFSITNQQLFIFIYIPSFNQILMSKSFQCQIDLQSLISNTPIPQSVSLGIPTLLYSASSFDMFTHTCLFVLQSQFYLLAYLFTKLQQSLQYFNISLNSPIFNNKIGNAFVFYPLSIPILAIPTSVQNHLSLKFFLIELKLQLGHGKFVLLFVILQPQQICLKHKKFTLISLQFSQFKEPPSQFLELLQQPLNVIKSKPNYFYKEYENSPNKFKRLRISTQHEGAVNNIVIDLNIPSPNFRVQQKLDYHDNNITIHSQITSQKTTPKTSRSNSPLKKVYLGSSLVAKRKLNGYVKRKKSPDPYEICRQMTKKIQYKKTETLTIASQTLFLLAKYGT